MIETEGLTAAVAAPFLSAINFLGDLGCGNIFDLLSANEPDASFEAPLALAAQSA